MVSLVVSKVDRLEYAYAVYPILLAILNQSQIVWEISNPPLNEFLCILSILSDKCGDQLVPTLDIRPIYNEEPMAEVQTTAEINIFATGQQHTEQPEFINEGEVDQNTEQCHDICPLPAKLTG
ncbi:hypothetical protein Tco_0236836 [Tanacetum coccineum]